MFIGGNPRGFPTLILAQWGITAKSTYFFYKHNVIIHEVQGGVTQSQFVGEEGSNLKLGNGNCLYMYVHVCISTAHVHALSHDLTNHTHFGLNFYTQLDNSEYSQVWDQIHM